ncbi:MAG: tetratricopeptide repeat protein [Blastocatellia bacterium]
MSSKYAFLRTKASFIIVGLILGLFTGFKIANSQYRREQGRALSSAAARSASGLPRAGGEHATAEIRAVIDKAKANPNDADAQMDAASQFIQIERPEEAMPFLEQAGKARPNDPRITAGLGVAQFMLGNLEQAATWLKKSRDLGATEPTVTSLLVGAYIQTGKNLDEADRLLKELESKGIDPVKLAQIRADLNAARGGRLGDTKSVLSHGPDDSKASSTGGKK